MKMKRKRSVTVTAKGKEKWKGKDNQELNAFGGASGLVLVAPSLVGTRWGRQNLHRSIQRLMRVRKGWWWSTRPLISRTKKQMQLLLRLIGTVTAVLDIWLGKFGYICVFKGVLSTFFAPRATLSEFQRPATGKARPSTDCTFWCI